ncbi:anoctamin-7 [Ixodes scapularis]
MTICMHGTVFLEIWKRRQASLAHRWNVDHFSAEEPDRPQFYGSVAIRDPITGDLTWHYPMIRRLAKYCCSVGFFIMMSIVVLISVLAVTLYQVYMYNAYCNGETTCEVMHGSIVAPILNTLSIMVLGKIYSYAAVRLTEWENHRTRSMYNDALVIKLFAFQFTNTYASLFYTAFFREGRSGLFGLGDQFKDRCGHPGRDTCMSMLSLQLLILMIVKPFPKFCYDVVWPLIKKVLRKWGIMYRVSDEKVSDQHHLLRELYKQEDAEFRRDEFAEKIIQYGYLMLFAASFPLAPLLALLYNMFDLRIDANRLLWLNRRPVAFRDDDIGMWFHLFGFINACGVVSNAFLIAFTSTFGKNLKNDYRRFIFIIAFEHLVFGVKFILTLAIPDTPTAVKNAKLKQFHHWEGLGGQTGTLGIAGCLTSGGQRTSFGTVFLEIWKRRQASLAHRWNVDHFSAEEPDRPQFYGSVAIRDPITGDLTWHYPMIRRLAKYCCSVGFFIMMSIVVLISVLAVTLYQVYMYNAYCNGETTCEVMHGSIVAPILNTLSIMVLGKVRQLLSIEVDDAMDSILQAKNHRTRSMYNDALVIKLFAFQFTNTYASLFYTAFFREGRSGLFGLGDQFRDRCGHPGRDTCMSMLSLQLLILMIVKPFPKFCYDVVWPLIKKVLRKWGIMYRVSDEKVSDQHHLLRELYKQEDAEFRRDEFAEKIIQYGYLMLFAASFPLAPLLALLYNMFDLRIDANRLLWLNRRPVAFRDDDIGMWFHLFGFINACGVVSNAFLIAFTSTFGKNLKNDYRRFIFIIAFEHLVFGVKFILTLAIPDTPTAVKNAKLKQFHHWEGLGGQTGTLGIAGCLTSGGQRTSFGSSVLIIGIRGD